MEMFDSMRCALRFTQTPHRHPGQHQPSGTPRAQKVPGLPCSASASGPGQEIPPNRLHLIHTQPSVLLVSPLSLLTLHWAPTLDVWLVSRRGVGAVLPWGLSRPCGGPRTGCILPGHQTPWPRQPGVAVHSPVGRQFPAVMDSPREAAAVKQPSQL